MQMLRGQLKLSACRWLCQWPCYGCSALANMFEIFGFRSMLSFTSSLQHSSSVENTEGERNSKMATTMSESESWSKNSRSKPIRFALLHFCRYEESEGTLPFAALRLGDDLSCVQSSMVTLYYVGSSTMVEDMAADLGQQRKSWSDHWCGSSAFAGLSHPVTAAVSSKKEMELATTSSPPLCPFREEELRLSPFWKWFGKRGIKSPMLGFVLAQSGSSGSGE